MSIEYRGENKWRFRVTFEGRQYSDKYFSIKQPKTNNKGKIIIPTDVEKAHNTFIVDVQRGEIGFNGTMTFGEFIKLYKAEYLSTLEGSTQISNNSIIKNHFLPTFENLKLNDIKTIDIQVFFNKKVNEKSKKDKVLSLKMIDKMYKQLRAIFNKAIAWGIIETNPCKNINIPKPIKRNLTQIYSQNELCNLISAINNLDNLMYKAFFSLSLFGGFRKGEVLALTINDLDFKENSVNINKQVTTYPNEDGIEKQEVKYKTKSHNSFRKVYLPVTAMANVKEYLQSMPHMFNKYLFWNFERNKLYNNTTVWYAFRKFLIENDLSIIKLHDLRHLNATMLINNNVNVVAVARSLGDTVRTVSDTYVHDIEEVRKEAADTLDKYINNLA